MVQRYTLLLMQALTDVYCTMLFISDFFFLSSMSNIGTQVSRLKTLLGNCRVKRLGEGPEMQAYHGTAE
jgi:hypothetical protein